VSTGSWKKEKSATGLSHGDRIVDRADDLRNVSTWQVPLDQIYNNAELRLDANRYDPQIASTLTALELFDFELLPMNRFAGLDLPGQFTRIWATDNRHGLPYVNATDLNNQSDLNSAARYLSEQSQVDIERLIIREGWLLMSCSGTIGRVFYVPKRLDGWVATHDLIRIIPNSDVPVGFLFAFLSSSFAQKQILVHTHGGQIDHITDSQLGTVLLPDLPKEKKFEIHKKSMSALSAREEAFLNLKESIIDLENTIRNE